MLHLASKPCESCKASSLNSRASDLRTSPCPSYSTISLPTTKRPCWQASAARVASNGWVSISFTLAPALPALRAASACLSFNDYRGHQANLMGGSYRSIVNTLCIKRACLKRRHSALYQNTVPQGGISLKHCQFNVQETSTAKSVVEFLGPKVPLFWSPQDSQRWVPPL